MSYDFDSSVNEIGNLASGIYKYDFDQDSSLASPDYISGWLQHNMGELNVLIHTSYSGEYPKMGDEEQAIYRQIFLKDYYKKLGRKILIGAMDSSNSSTTDSTSSGSSTVITSDWTELRDGDSVIRRQAMLANPATKVTASKQYAQFSADADFNIKELLYKYNSTNGGPRQVYGVD
jgi:hypothetical protein